MDLTQSQLNQLKRLKANYPDRIIFAVIDKNTGEFLTYAKPIKHYAKSIPHYANKLAKQGHEVAIYG